MAESYDFKQVESDVLEFWKKHNTYQELRLRNAGKKPFYYLDGPPYTTGRIHIGHAWGKALRDAVLRYKAMRGFDVWDRPGFDMHGLPIEVSVEKQLGIETKDEIVNKLGVQKFVEACQAYAVEQMQPMIEDFKRLGIWMKWDDPYMTIKNEYIEGAWWALAQAHKKNLLYQGKKSMCWCPRCATALAKHELDYKDVTDHAIFVKLKVSGRDQEYLVVWTTTPWTIPFNLAVMAHPEFEYARVQLSTGETWILAKELAPKLLEKTGERYEILETFPGAQLAGIQYEPALGDLSAIQKLRKTAGKHVFSVILSDQYVDLSTGSGLVHCAPGCGPEDFEVGSKHALPAFNETTEHGSFPTSMGHLAGLRAKVDDHKFIEELKKRKVIIMTESVRHEYAHCWRCKTAVIFRATDQWFLAVEQLRETMRKENQSVNWTPDWAGSRWFDSWLSTLQDWCISRQRFWGIPLPIWKCNHCGKVQVIATQQELQEKSGKLLSNLHRPWVDEVKLHCTCGTLVSRTPDVLDVWLDSGVAAWATLGYPRKTESFNTLGVPDLILEGKDQIRGWFNSLMCMSMVSLGKVPYKAVYMHGMINDAQGRKMSKSLKNTISPYEVTEKHGADTLRYYSIGGTKPGLDLNYNFADATLKYKNINVLWNLHSLLLDLLNQSGESIHDLAAHKAAPALEERYIKSLLAATTERVSELFDSYAVSEIPSQVENLFLRLSRTYIQLVREKMALDEDERALVILTLADVLSKALILFAPIAPFVCEALWQRLRGPLALKETSVHLARWPKTTPNEKNVQLLEDFEAVEDVVAAVLFGREKMKRNLRWPLKSITLVTSSEKKEESLRRLAGLLQTQVNAKEILFSQKIDGVTHSPSIIHAAVGKAFGKRKPAIEAALATPDGELLYRDLQKQGFVLLRIGAEEVKLTSEHLAFKETSPEYLVAAEFKDGMAYIDKRTNDALESEGFSREVIRQVQSLRKSAGLTKKDSIDLVIHADAQAQKYLHSWKEIIASKTGSKSVLIQSPGTLAKSHATEEIIKGSRVAFGFERV